MIKWRQLEALGLRKKALIADKIAKEDAGLLAVWDFLEQLERQDTYIVDAAWSAAEVQAELVAYLTQALASEC